VLGVSWLVTSFALFILVYIIVFGHGSGLTLGQYALYVTIGFGVWSFISSVVSDSCVVYTASSGWILGSSIPYPVFFLQGLFRNLVVFSLTLLVIVGALVWKKESWSTTELYAIPAVLSYVLPPIWLAAILAPLCARYRDLHHAVQTGMRLMFFVTPILWLPTQRAQFALMAKYNPVAYFIDIVRSPLIYDVFPAHSWGIVIATNIIGMLIGLVVYTLTRNRIVYWL
jgi:lipopolysaccharide transport system permease protein